MKGIHIQFEGIVKFIDSALTNQNKVSLQCYLLNLQRITLETFTILNIVIANAPEEIPEKVKLTFEETINKFKDYFKKKPKLEADKQEPEDIEYDEVQELLDNRIDLSQNNDSERGELYKFLNESEETEKNNQLLLENKPVYNFGKLKQKKTLMEEISEPISFEVPLVERAQQTYSHDFVEKQPELQKKEAVEAQDDEAQTENSIEAFRQLVDIYSSQIQNNQNWKESKEEMKQLLKSLEGCTKTVMTQVLGKKITAKMLVKKKKSNGLAIALPGNDKSIKNLSEIQAETVRSQKNKTGTKLQSKVSSQRSALPQKAEETKKTINQQTERKDKATYDRKDSNRHSINAQLASILNHGVEKPSRQSIFHENNDESERQKDVSIEKDSSICIKDAPKQQKQRHSRQSNRTVNINETVRQNRASVQKDCSSLGNKDDMNPRINILNEGELLRMSEQDTKEHWKNEEFVFNEMQDNQANHPVEKERRNLRVAGNSILFPVIEQSKQQSRASFESTPYGNSLYKNFTLKQNEYKRKSRNSDHQSLYMGHSHNKSLSKLGNMSIYSGPNQIKKQPNSRYEGEAKKELGDSYNKLLSEDKSQFLEQQNKRIMKEIADNTSLNRNKNVQWAKLIKNIRQYETVHIRFCGQNCCHLKRFEQFLKKNNLSMYANRKQFQLHKKTLEINSQMM